MKKLIFILPVLLAAIALFNMPGMVSSAIPSAYYITPDKKTYESLVNCQGTIQSADVREVYLQSMIVPEKVCVEIGDKVSAGDTIVVVNEEMTGRLAVSASDILNGISGEAASAAAVDDLGGGGIDWLSIASKYGLTAALSGGQIDYAKLQGLFTDSGSGLSTTSGAIAESFSPSEIVSPISGTVIDVALRPDTPAAAGRAILTIADTDNFKVLCAVSESDISKICVGNTAKIRGVGFSGSVYDGVVEKIYPVARKPLGGADTVVDVMISLENPDDKLKPGFSAKVEIKGGNNYELVTVPYEAIRQDENNDEYVYVYQNGKLKKQVVVTGQELTSEVEILGGLTDSSIVVYNPGGLIKEGSMISLKGRATT